MRFDIGTLDSGERSLPVGLLVHNIMHVLVTSKFEKDRININGDYVMTSIF